MIPYIFVLGRVPELSYREIESLFPGVYRSSRHIVRLDTPINKTPKEILQILGGTTKIGHYIGTITTITLDNIIKLFTGIQTSVIFGLSGYDSVNIPKDIHQKVKSTLRQQGIDATYVLSKHKTHLDSVVVSKKHVYELVFYPGLKGIDVAKTLEVQDFEEWSSRDLERIHFDSRSGMLPTKVARMIVNITMGQSRIGTILDPFCGMGTVVSEAAYLGYSAICSDISEQVVRNAKDNVLKLEAKAIRSVDNHLSFYTSDAVKISNVIPHDSIDAIITEPFMGDARAIKYDQNVKNIIKGLEKLYIGCLKDWKLVLRKAGKIMISFPSISTIKGEISVKKPIDMCEILGYTKVLGPIEYARLGARVKRHFYLFQKN